jgi:hypothetical protein
MPVNVRNFWIEGQIDGRSTRIEAGPQAKDGGFSLTIYQRDKGSVVKAVTIRGWHESTTGHNLLVVSNEYDHAAPAITVRTVR